MGAAAYNRGSAVVSRELADAAGVANRRADRDAYKAERDRLREHVRTLERDLARARRCIAELRRSKDARVAEARAEQSSNAAAVRILARMAFPEDSRRAA